MHQPFSLVPRAAQQNRDLQPDSSSSQGRRTGWFGSGLASNVT